MKVSKFITAPLCLGILLFSLPNTCLAEGLSVQVNPPTVQIQAKKDSKPQFQLAIQNHQDRSESFDILFKPFSSSSTKDGSINYLSAASSEYNNLFQNIHIYDKSQEISTLSLAPKQRKKLKLVLDIKPDQKEQDYYFSVVFLSQLPSKPDVKNAVMIRGAVASHILLSVSNTIMSEGKIEEFSAPPFIQTGPVLFTLKLKNDGKNFITPSGELLITNMFNQPIGKVDLSSHPILAQSSRYLSNNISKDINEGYPTIGWHDSLLIGPYSATVSLRLGPQGPMLSQTISFFVFPYKTFITLGLVIILILFLRSRVKRHLRHK